MSAREVWGVMGEGQDCRTPHAAELVRRSQAGDPEAFAGLIAAYQTQVYNLALRLAGNPADAEDLAQEVFIRLYHVLPQYRGEAAFSTWLYRVATNVCLQWLRKRRLATQPLTEVGCDLPPPDPHAGPEQGVQRRELQAAVQRAVLELPPAYRVVVALHYLEELTYREMAEILEVPVRTVETRLYRARQLLRARLAGWVEEREEGSACSHATP